MRTKILTVTTLAGLTLGAGAGQCFDYQSYEQFSRFATQSEHEGRWQQVHWLKDMTEAKARAKAENKPILVFLVIGFHGEKNASDC